MGDIHKWWGELVGGTDDSLFLLDYFQQTGSKERVLELARIFKDFHLSEALREGTVATADLYLKVDGFEPHVDLAIDIVIDLSAIVLETLQEGEFDLSDIDEGYTAVFTIKSKPADLQLLMGGLSDFIENAENYELSDLIDEEDLETLIEQCSEIRKGLEEFTA